MPKLRCENCKIYLAYENPDQVIVALLKLINALECETDDGMKKTIHSHRVNEAIDDAKYILKSLPGFSCSKEYGRYLAEKVQAIKRGQV